MQTVLVWVLFVFGNVPGSVPVIMIHETEKACGISRADVLQEIKEDKELQDKGMVAHCKNLLLVIPQSGTSV